MHFDQGLPPYQPSDKCIQFSSPDARTALAIYISRLRWSKRYKFIDIQIIACISFIQRRTCEDAPSIETGEVNKNPIALGLQNFVSLSSHWFCVHTSLTNKQLVLLIAMAGDVLKRACQLGPCSHSSNNDRLLRLTTT
jgi:hypothetical protein